MIDFARVRRNMVDSQLRTFDVTDLAVLTAMNDVPRELFVPAGREMLAYADRNVELGEGGPEGPRFMLAPMYLARMLQELEVKPGAKVLDVASGLGYSAAVLAHLGATVTALEPDGSLAGEARRKLAEVGCPGVEVMTLPLDGGCPERAPFDRILINGAVQVRPQALLDQLADGGRLACLERSSRAGRAMLYVRAGDAFGARPIFNAAAPVLPAFRAEPGFVF